MCGNTAIALKAEKLSFILAAIKQIRYSLFVIRYLLLVTPLSLSPSLPVTLSPTPV